MSVKYNRQHSWNLLLNLFIYLQVSHSLNNAVSNRRSSESLLILLDRDGVINDDVGPPGVLSSSQLKLTPNAASAIGSLKRKGHIVDVITNQSCVGKGLISMDTLHDIHSNLQSMLWTEDKDATIDAFYSCTSTSTMYDFRRKPNPGMIHEAFLQYMKTIHSEPSSSQDVTWYRERCVLIGDSWRDLEAAAVCGIDRRVLVSTGYGLECMNYRKPSPYSVLRVDSPLFYNSLDVPREDSTRKTIDIEPPNKVFPFYYTENLSSAINWLLRSI